MKMSSEPGNYGKIEVQYPFSSSETVRSIRGGMSLPALLSVTGDFPAQSSAPLIFNFDSSSFTSDSSFDAFTLEPMLTSLASKLDSLKSELVQVVVLSSKVVAKVLERRETVFRSWPTEMYPMYETSRRCCSRSPSTLCGSQIHSLRLWCLPIQCRSRSPAWKRKIGKTKTRG